MPQRSWYLLKQIGLRSVPQRLADKLELRQDEVADNEEKNDQDKHEGMRCSFCLVRRTWVYNGWHEMNWEKKCCRVKKIIGLVEEHFALYAKKFRQISKPHHLPSRAKIMRDGLFLETLTSLAVFSISRIGNHFRRVQKWHRSSHGNHDLRQWQWLLVRSAM